MTIRNVVYSTVFLLGSLSTSAEANINQFQGTFPSLPLQQREEKFNEVQKGFEERSNFFLKGKHFQTWSSNRPKQEIFDEFTRINEWRNHSWYSESGEFLISRQDFMIAQDLLEKGLYRRPHLIAFQYNQTDGSYNSSSIVLNGQRFLAMEAPTAKNVTQFFKLLQNHQVTQLVRLTPAESKGESQSYPYWQDRLKTKTQNKAQVQFLQLPLAGIHKTFPVQYYFTDEWQDNEGIDPKSLMKLILEVRKNYSPDNGLLACHCRAGVGRTGTFIAGFILLQEIDRQIAAGTPLNNLDISIEKVVMQLSLQRAYMVSQPEQYLTLYRLVDAYMQTLKKK